MSKKQTVSYKDASRRNYVIEFDKSLLQERNDADEIIKLGLLMRIADALERPNPLFVDLFNMIEKIEVRHKNEMRSLRAIISLMKKRIKSLEESQ